MSNSSVASTESLLYKGEIPNARCGGKAFVFLAFALGLGLGAMIAVTSAGQTMNESAIDMGWQSTLAQPSQSMVPAKSLPAMQNPRAFQVMQSPMASANPGLISRPTSSRAISTNALYNPSALTGSGLSQNGVPDLRQALGFTPGQKCVRANQHASLCGNIVFLRPSTALRATDKDSSVDAEQILKDLSEKWDAVEDKTTVALYGGGALVALYLTNGILSTVNAIPLLPGLLETVGLGYAGYFAYRYLLTKSSRQELVADIDELKKKISG